MSTRRLNLRHPKSSNMGAAGGVPQWIIWSLCLVITSLVLHARQLKEYNEKKPKTKRWEVRSPWRQSSWSPVGNKYYNTNLSCISIGSRDIRTSNHKSWLRQCYLTTIELAEQVDFRPRNWSSWSIKLIEDCQVNCRVNRLKFKSIKST